MTVTLRFAPSPTGRLHIGNVRTGVLNWLFARQQGGTFLLRLDDTDVARSSEAFAEAIREDLAWLGLAPAREERQSARSALYRAAAERLEAAGRLYPCYESEEELDRRRRRQRARGLPPLYDRAALALSAAETARLAAEGRRPHWRFRLANSGRDLVPRPTPVGWDDLVRGPQTVDLGSLSDPVLVRADGTFLYTFTSVVDDIDLAVTHVIRGEDHVTNTGVQLDLFAALGAPAPRFAHHSLLVGADGAALSKRDAALSIAGMRERGLEPLAVAAYAALIGTSEAVAPVASLDALARRFSFDKISRAPARFEMGELEGLSARHLHGLDHALVAGRLAALGVGGGEAFWLAVRANLATLADARAWWEIAQAPIDPVVERPELLAAARRLLPAEPWGPGTWKEWTARIAAESGAKGRALFHPLRLALTGRESGPSLEALLPFIGRTRAAARLAGERG
jgi:glutamyl-tRNA synthetase